jgi:YgiT-type zinc finger domain-containing protein
MRCASCDQGDRAPVRRAKLAERDGRIAVVLDVPMEECPACGVRWLTLEVAESLDTMLRRLISSGAETSTAHWDELAPSAA